METTDETLKVKELRSCPKAVHDFMNFICRLRGEDEKFVQNILTCGDKINVMN